MPKVISKETANRARELRSNGNSYEQISKDLNVSISWCKHNLSSLQDPVKEIVSTLEQKSRTKKGVSRGEIAKALNADQPKEQIKKEVQKMTQRLRKRNKENIVRPNWMMPELAVFITNKIVEECMAAEQRINDQSFELHQVLLNSCDNEEQRASIPSTVALKSAITALVYTMTNQSSKSGSILENWLQSLYDTAIKLEQRNKQAVINVKTVNFTAPNDLIDVSDLAY